PVDWETFRYTSKIHVLFGEIIEMVGEIESVFVVVLGVVGGELLFGHGFSKSRNRFGVPPRFVVQAAEVIEAQAEFAAIDRVIGLCASQALEDVDGPLDRPERLDVLMGFVLDRRDLPAAQGDLRLILDDRRVSISKRRSVNQ